MKLTSFLLAAFLAAPAFQTPLRAESRDIRLMTYNVHNGIGMDNKTDYQRIVAEIEKYNPTFVSIQEVDSATRRSDRRYVLGELALGCRMYPTFAGAIPMGNGKYGIGLLSKERPLNVQRIPLPGREEKRVLLIAEFERCYVAATHFSLHEEDELASVKILQEAVAGLNDKPVLLAGDLNAIPEGPVIEELKKSFQIINPVKENTYPADKPDRTIDYIALRNSEELKLYVPSGSSRVISSEASDHRPVVASFRYQTPAKDFFYGDPYLQNPGNEAVSILFQTRTPSSCWVEYTCDSLVAAQGKPGEYRARTLIGGQEPCHDIEQKIRLEGLQPGKTYYYRVCGRELLENRAYKKAFGDTVRTAYHSFTLPQKEERDFTAIIFNDTHCSRGLENQLAQLIKNIPHDLIFFNGDCLPEPADREEAIRNINRVATLFGGASTPIYFIRGNHEIRNAYSSGMHSLFDYPTDTEEQYPNRESFGAFSWGDTRFVLLDGGEDKPDDTWVYYGLNDFTEFRERQAEFLKKEMKSKVFRNAESRILLSHIPVWGNEPGYNPCHDMWAPLFSPESFNVALFGHTHQFRYHPTKTTENNPFPVYVGGGPSKTEATVAVLKKRGKQLTLEILSAEGKLLESHNL